MELKKQLTTALLSLGICFNLSAAQAENTGTPDLPTDSPVGYWKTIDDVSGEAKSIVQIWKTDNNVLMGKIVKIFPTDGSNPETKICKACKGEQHNQPIIGLVIMSGLTPKEHQWGNGAILDPQNGKSYHCAVRTLENGKKLNVRGYMGLPLLGRSQTWERVDLMSG